MKKSIAKIICSGLIATGAISLCGNASAQILSDTSALGVAYGDLVVQQAEDEARYKIFHEKLLEIEKLQGDSKEKNVLDDEKHQRLHDKLDIRAAMLEQWAVKKKELLKSADIKPAISADGKVPLKPAELVAAKSDMNSKAESLKKMIYDVYEMASENGDRPAAIKEKLAKAEILRQELRKAAAKYVTEYWKWNVKPGRGIDSTENDFLLLTKNGYVKMESQQLKLLSRTEAASRVAFMLKAVEDGVYSQISPESVSAMARLRAEYSAELATMGYFDDEAAQIQVETQAMWESQIKSPKQFKIDGEIRIDHRKNSGDVSNDSFLRLRNRLYGDYNIDGNWHAIAMIESQKYLSGRGNDHWLELERYYLSGNIGELFCSAGVMGATMAEGNIYDSKFKGIMLQAGESVRYTLRHGSLNNAHNATELTASYTIGGSYHFSGGYHGFDIDGLGRRTIYTGNIVVPLAAKLSIGAMYLSGRDSRVGNGNGYVFTLAYGRESSWQKGNAAYFFKYYYQPRATYVQHTMNGTADSMDGFKGIGMGVSYTLQENILASMEYYRLHELTGNRSNNTFWIGLSYFYH